MIVLPLLVTWGIWLARNKLVFQGKECTPAITAGMVCGIATALPKHVRVKNQRDILVLELIDHLLGVSLMVPRKITFVEVGQS